jgi:superfamily II DNA or RNA helicase
VHGGPVIEDNLAAWCAPCNLKNGPRDVADGRVLARQWQLDALDPVIKRLIDSGAATVSAAPGAGKTIFAGLVFEHLHELEFVDRMVVLVPRRTLMSQWADALVRGRHLELRPDTAYERTGTHQVGVVATYQSLIQPEQRLNHRMQLIDRPTLLVLDEVHHVGERLDTRFTVPAWAQYVRDLAGTVEPLDLHVKAVLNLSGTLWRSNEGERISTVRYSKLPNGRLQSVVDYEVTTEDLIGQGQLRPVDIFRLGAHVEISDFANLKVIDSHIADLDEKPARAAIAHLGNDATWRTAFVNAVLDRLEAAYRSLNKFPVKALIVAATQDQARLMRETADDLMYARGLKPMSSLAISDEPEASKVLEIFRKAKTPGVLCTVDMAGEGYDCPDIAVVGFASNKQTPLYIRQVVARAQRVTAREREQGRPIPATVVLPDTSELVELMVSILKPIHHEILTPAAPPPPPPGPPKSPPPPPGPPAYSVERVDVDEDFTVNVTGMDDGEVVGAMVTAMEKILVEVQLRPADASRFIVAARRFAKDRREDQPFDPLSDDEVGFEDLGNATRPKGRPTSAHARPMADEVQARRVQARVAKAARWWKVNAATSGVSVEHFNANINRFGEIPRGGRKDATVEQLERAWEWAVTTIFQYCDEHEIERPRVERW